MVPLEGPYQKKTEGARAKAAPLATAVSAKRATRSKPAASRKSVVVSENVLEPRTTTVVSGEPIRSEGLPEDAIRLSAYFKWVVAGRPDVDGVDFWLEAERELLLQS